MTQVVAQFAGQKIRSREKLTLQQRDKQLNDTRVAGVAVASSSN